jgi:hypothetical protein
MADLKDLLGEIFRGSIWSTPPVSEQPVIVLIRWRVVEVQTKELRIERHFIGYNLEDHEGRVSSAIHKFNAELGQGVTRSGRVYQLMGSPGYDQDGQWVWANWSQINQFSNERDVTAELWQLISDIQPDPTVRG